MLKNKHTLLRTLIFAIVQKKTLRDKLEKIGTEDKNVIDSEIVENDNQTVLIQIYLSYNSIMNVIKCKYFYLIILYIA